LNIYSNKTIKSIKTLLYII